MYRLRQWRSDHLRFQQQSLPIVRVRVVRLVARATLPVDRLHATGCTQLVAMNAHPQHSPMPQAVAVASVVVPVAPVIAQVIDCAVARAAVDIAVAVVVVRPDIMMLAVLIHLSRQEAIPRAAVAIVEIAVLAKLPR